jgi:hypothetical protein
MSATLTAAIASLITGAFEVWRINSGKPEGWKPTPEDVAELLALVDEATPEARKQLARERLGLH